MTCIWKSEERYTLLETYMNYANATDEEISVWYKNRGVITRRVK